MFFFGLNIAYTGVDVKIAYKCNVNSNMKSLVTKPNSAWGNFFEINNVLLVDIIQHLLFCKREDDTWQSHNANLVQDLTCHSYLILETTISKR